MIGRFEKDGWPKSHLSAYSYNTSQSNKVSAEKRSNQASKNLHQSDRRVESGHRRPLDGQPQRPLVHQFPGVNPKSTMVVPRRDDGRILLTKRADDGTWWPPPPGRPRESFARMVVEEFEDR
jgi:hypothetical protein